MSARNRSGHRKHLTVVDSTDNATRLGRILTVSTIAISTAIPSSVRAAVPAHAAVERLPTISCVVWKVVDSARSSGLDDFDTPSAVMVMMVMMAVI